MLFENAGEEIAGAHVMIFLHRHLDILTKLTNDCFMIPKEIDNHLSTGRIAGRMFLHPREG